MRFLILVFFFISFLYSEQYTFLVDKYEKEMELEAKIISNIAKSSLNEDIKLFIPKLENNEKKIYSKFFKLTNTCSDANFIFVKKSVDIFSLCKIEKKIFFTNNYRRLLDNNIYLGAFFWSKSRPNITFIKDRLNKLNLQLPKDYQKFIEDIK